MFRKLFAVSLLETISNWVRSGLDFGEALDYYHATHRKRHTKRFSAMLCSNRKLKNMNAY